MALRKISSIIQALQLLVDGHDLYDRFGNVVVVRYLKIGQLEELFYRPKMVRRMMTAEEAIDWSCSPGVRDTWFVRRPNDNRWRYPAFYEYDEPINNYRRFELIEGEVFQPIDFSIEVEDD